MSIKIKYKILRLINLGVLEVENFGDKKNVQIYNTFLLLAILNIFIYGILLAIYEFYLQLFFIGSLVGIMLLALILNKYNEIRLSKIIVIQFFIIAILGVLIIFSFETVFVLFFFLVILFSTLIFSEKEANEKIFFIIQCFFLFFIALTPLKNYLPNMNLLPISKIPEMNFITIVDFILFLFTYIYFQTKYQQFKEQKYTMLNKRLYENNLKIRHENTKKRILVAITSNLLEDYFSKYNTTFDNYLAESNKKEKDKSIVVQHFETLNELNSKIEEVLNYQFSKNRVKYTLNTKHVEIISLTKEVIQKLGYKINLVSKEDIKMKIHEDLYEYFLMEIINKFDAKKNNIQISLHKKEEPIPINASNSKIIDVLGIQLNYRFEQSRNLFITLYFFNNPNLTSIYNV